MVVSPSAAPAEASRSCFQPWNEYKCHPLTTGLALALQQCYPVLVKLELGDDHVRGVDADLDGSAVGLFAGEADVDDVFAAVHGGNLALAALLAAADNGDLIILADGEGADLATGEKEKKEGQNTETKEDIDDRQTLYFLRSSSERAALMITRRTEEGAAK